MIGSSSAGRFFFACSTVSPYHFARYSSFVITPKAKSLISCSRSDCTMEVYPTRNEPLMTTSIRITVQILKRALLLLSGIYYPYFILPPQGYWQEPIGLPNWPRQIKVYLLEPLERSLSPLHSIYFKSGSLEAWSITRLLFSISWSWPVSHSLVNSWPKWEWSRVASEQHCNVWRERRSY